MVFIGEKAPVFCLKDQDDNTVCLEDYTGKWVVLYFYPKDNTPGCTLEAKNFSDSIEEFDSLNAVIIGISPDPVKSHHSFKDNHSLRVILLSDPNHIIIDQYDKWKQKTMYGKQFYGVERSTFLIDPSGNIGHIWSTVNVPNHVEEVKSTLIELQNG